MAYNSRYTGAQIDEGVGGGLAAVPGTREVNGKPLSADVTLAASDIAMADGATVEEAVSGLFTSVSEGKAAVASAVTDMGVATAADAAFADIAANIRRIETGAELTLAGLSVAAAPARTAYAAGETFDPAGMVVAAEYAADGFSGTFSRTVTDYTYSPDGALTTDDAAVTVSYAEGGAVLTASVAIAVTEPGPAVIAFTVVYNGESIAFRAEEGMTLEQIAASDYALSADPEGSYRIYAGTSQPCLALGDGTPIKGAFFGALSDVPQDGETYTI